MHQLQQNTAEKLFTKEKKGLVAKQQTLSHSMTDLIQLHLSVKRLLMSRIRASCLWVKHGVGGYQLCECLQIIRILSAILHK